MVEIKRAKELDPLSLIIRLNLALVLMASGELEAAVEECKESIEMNPNSPRGYTFLGLAYQKQGRYEEAIAEYRKAIKLSGRESICLTLLGECYGVAGKRAEARIILKELEEKYTKGESNGLYLANVCAVLGEKDRAFYWLEKDFQGRNGLLGRLPYSPVFYTLRELLQSDPRWDDLLRRIGIPQ